MDPNPIKFTRITVKIPSETPNVFLDVWYYRPTSTAGPHPVVVAGHGLTAIKEAGLAAFGERWATDAGYASLILDYRGFGDSDGHPRNVVTNAAQLEDYKSVITWAVQHPEDFRTDKIVVMGSAGSGMQVANLVVNDERIAGGMAHCPLLDGLSTLKASPANPRLLFWAVVDVIRNSLGMSPIYVPLAAAPNEFGLLNSPSTVPGFTSMFSQGKVPFHNAPNVIAPRYAFEMMFRGDAGLHLSKAKCPMLVVMAEGDDLIPSKVTKDVVEKSQGKVKLVSIPCGHFDIMKGGSGFGANINAQIAFLRELL